MTKKSAQSHTSAPVRSGCVRCYRLQLAGFTKPSTICLVTVSGNSMVSLLAVIAVTVPSPNIGCEIYLLTYATVAGIIDFRAEARIARVFVGFFASAMRRTPGVVIR